MNPRARLAPFRRQSQTPPAGSTAGGVSAWAIDGALAGGTTRSARLRAEPGVPARYRRASISGDQVGSEA